MDYLKPKFSVASPCTSTYADNWERTFKGEQTPTPAPTTTPDPTQFDGADFDNASPDFILALYGASNE